MSLDDIEALIKQSQIETKKYNRYFFGTNEKAKNN